MPRKIRRASYPFAVKVLTALAVAAAFGNASAAGLGKLTVLSALGQPLRAEIDLTSVSKDEADSLVAKLASTQAFKQANVEFNPALMSLRFAVEQRGSRQIIRVSSSQPINEPYVGMLIELSSSRGRLLREYTFLLDPPELRQAQAASLAAAPVVTQLPAAAQKSVPVPQTVAVQQKVPATRTAQSEKLAASESVTPESGKPSDRTQKMADSNAEDKAAVGEYWVRKGDTLGTIAGRFKHDDVSLDQMLVSMYRANPEAFVGNNMNRLKSGKVMTIPDAAEAGSISQPEARRIIIAQSNDFDQYRNRLAKSVVQAQGRQAEHSSQAASGRITAKVEEQPSVVSKSVDRLKLSKENAAASDKPAPVVSTEDKLSQDKSLADAQTRIRELEKNIKELQSLLELKSKDLAVQQKQAEAATVLKPDQPAAQAPAAIPPVAAVQPQPSKLAVKPKTFVPPPPPPAPSLIDDLLDNPAMLGGIAAAILGVAYLIWSKIRRKRQSGDATSRFMGEPMTESPNSLFGNTGGQSINTNNSVFNSSFSPSAMQVDASEVDPVAEADVYIAYGREAQAIEILKDALRAQPDRNAVRIKLLEIYASQKDVLSFDALASDLYALTKGEGEDWAYAAKMGASIDPKNPLYTDMGALEEIADKPVSIHAFTNPVEALDPDSLTAPSRMSQEPLQSAATELESMMVTDDSMADQWADLPLDIGSAESWPTTRPATPEEKPFEKSEMDDLLDWPLETEEPAVSQAQESGKTVHVQEAGRDAPLEFESATKPPQVRSEDDELQLFDASPVAVESAGEVIQHQPTDVPASAASAASQAEQSVAILEPAATAAPLEFDFSSISLDLGTSGSDDKKPVFGDLPSSVHIEMATKLDLAVAYMEIGDKEGAKELLDEVIKGGDDEQVAKARDILAKMK